MPKVVKIQHHGKTRWRVIVPPTGGEPRKVRLFKSQADASMFASGLSGLRDGALGDFMRLPQPDRARLLRCLSVAGGIDALESAVGSAVASRPKLDKLLAEATRECVEAKRKSGCSWQYVENLSVALSLFTRAHNGLKVSDVTGPMVDTWLHSGDWSAETRRTYLRRLATFFAWSRKQGWCVSDPCVAVERPKRGDGAIHILTPDECRRLLNTCREIDPGLLPYFAIGLFAGLRPDEIKRLQQESVRGEWIEVQAAKSKTRRRRLVEIHPTLKAWLALGGEIGWTNWRRRWRVVREKAAVNWAADIMRHSFCSYAYPIHGAHWTSTHAGHSEQVLFAHYRELVTVENAKEFWAIAPPASIG